MKTKLKKGDIKTFFKRAIKFVSPHGFVVLYKRRLAVSQLIGNTPDDKKVAVVAAYRDTKYVAHIKRAAKMAGYRVSNYPGDAKYVWLHWYENGIKTYDDFVRKLSMVQAWKAQDKKIIVHIHNKKPHESPIPSISHALMTALCDSADHVSIMSDETKPLLRDTWYSGDDFSRVSKVPHPNYIDTYGKMLQPPATLKNDTLKILFFGQVRPYKGIEYLIEATSGLDNIEISILGIPKDDEYIEKLKALRGDRKNVIFRLEFIPDDDIPGVFASHHIVALPYSIESSLNSGAAILALSYGRTVVGTNNGTLTELGDSSVYFGYDYKDEADHVKQLRKTIIAIQGEYGADYNRLLEVGERAYHLVERENNLDVIASAVDSMVRRVDQFDTRGVVQ